MLDSVRNYAGHWALKVILGAIALVFLFSFGAPSAFDTAEYAATVDGEGIPFEDFQAAFENQMSARRARGLPDEIQEQMLIGQVLDQLIEAELLRQFADEQSIHVSKAELAETITKEPYLQDEQTNQFIGKQKYLEFLEVRGIDVVDYEKDIRDGIRVGKARAFIESSVKVTDAEVKEDWRARNEKVNLRFLRVDGPAMTAALKDDPVSDKDVLDFEMKFPGLVEELYAEQKESRWTTPGKATLRQITIRKPAAGKGDADSAKRRADRALELAATDWKKAAEQYSEGPAWEKEADAREVSRRELPLVIADKAFSMKPEDPTTLVETPTSYVVLDVESVTPEKVIELDEKLKREIIVEQIRAKRAEDAVESFAKEAFAKLEAGESIEKVAARRNLAVKETGAFTVKSSFPGLPDADASLVRAAFALEEPGAVLKVDGGIPHAGNAYVLAVLKEHVKPDESKFEQEKVWLEGMLQRTRAAEAFRAWKAARLAETRVVRNERLLPTS